MTGPGRIDVHAHFVPDVYRATLEAAGLGQPDGMPQLPDWDDARHLQVMDRLDIEVALLSISSPGVHLGEGHDTASLARAVNEAGHHVVRAHPDRFGLLASLPLPDVEDTLDEVAYAYDILSVDGVALLTNAGGTYLGNATLEPVFDELDRRHARVLIHPTSPVCWEHTTFGRPRPMLEFLFDTASYSTRSGGNSSESRQLGEGVTPVCGPSLRQLSVPIQTSTSRPPNGRPESPSVPSPGRSRGRTG